MSGAIATPGAAADPRLEKSSLDHASYPNRVLTTLYDPNISLEEYLYYAKLSRAEENRLFGPASNYKQSAGPIKRFALEKLGRKKLVERDAPAVQLQLREKTTENGSDSPNESISGPAIICEEEWLEASRAARTAAWGAVFYLITTDILGPFSVPWAFSQLGYGPAISLYTIFGALSGYGGWQLWKMFVQIDSDRYPLKGYGDLAFRIFGPWARHVANVLQSFQFFLGVALIILTSGQSLSQMAKSKLCFIVCILVSTIAGLIIGQVRTLARFGWLATLAVILNLIVILFTMGIVSGSSPNYDAVAASYPGVLPDPTNPAPVSHTGGSPPGLTFIDNINGLMQAVSLFRTISNHFP
jgi:Transmembrane amino acid transporter protein